MANKSQNILVIEDNSDMLEGIISVLEYSGYQPEGTTQVNESLRKKLKNDHFGLIILDLMLSGKDGRDIAKEFKSSEETGRVPILMISAYPNVEDSVREAGADDFLQKPFGLDELIQKVEGQLA